MGGSKEENDRKKAYDSLRIAVEKAGEHFLHVVVC